MIQNFSYLGCLEVSLCNSSICTSVGMPILELQNLYKITPSTLKKNILRFYPKKQIIFYQFILKFLRRLVFLDGGSTFFFEGGVHIEAFMLADIMMQLPLTLTLSTCSLSSLILMFMQSQQWTLTAPPLLTKVLRPSLSGQDSLVLHIF